MTSAEINSILERLYTEAFGDVTDEEAYHAVPSLQLVAFVVRLEEALEVTLPDEVLTKQILTSRTQLLTTLTRLLE
ncbi:MAG TPA: hypothetical protein VKM72_14040 [Thermoanaerobaculia bacterium]|nr:hypothetical protein [Thermoanaerobaculia bacterium]